MNQHELEMLFVALDHGFVVKIDLSEFPWCFEVFCLFFFQILRCCERCCWRFLLEFGSVFGVVGVSFWNLVLFSIESKP